jgi:hypothetical protein
MISGIPGFVQVTVPAALLPVKNYPKNWRLLLPLPEHPPHDHDAADHLPDGVTALKTADGACRPGIYGPDSGSNENTGFPKAVSGREPVPDAA